METGAARVAALWGPVLAVMAAIFWLSAQPHLPAPPGALSDKHVHALVYGALAALCSRALSGGRWAVAASGRAAAAWLIAAAYGASDEWHQSFVPGRSAEWADLAADATGAAIAVLGLRAWGIIHARRHHGTSARADLAANRRS